jgi:glycosyltransferase involved in cell wall biosynthesis
MNLAIIYHAYKNNLDLEKSLRSVIEQSDGNFELFLCNDGGTKQVNEILKKIPFEKLKNLSYYSSNQNLGHSITYNNVVNVVQTKYVYYMGSNVILDVDFVKTINGLIEKYKEIDIFMFTNKNKGQNLTRRYTSISSDLQYYFSQSMKYNIFATKLLRDNHIILNNNKYTPLLFMYQVMSNFKTCVLINKKMTTFVKAQSYTYNLYDIFESNNILLSEYVNTRFYKNHKNLIEYLMIISVLRFFLIRIYESYGDGRELKIALNKTQT